jgi:flagellar hook-basal body complex protein FliE
MAIPFNAAASAYANAAKLINNAAKGVTAPAEPTAGDGQDFAKLLGQAVQGVVNSGRASDTATTNMINGKGDMVDVVTALSQTELALDTMVSVRDRVISAYEEIMRMPI